MFTLTAASLFSGCAQVTIKDQKWYADAGKHGALELHTLNNQQRWIDKITWDALRMGMVCTTTDNFADNKGNIEKLCSFSSDCTYETQQAIKAFFVKLKKAHKLEMVLRAEPQAGLDMNSPTCRE